MASPVWLRVIHDGCAVSVSLAPTIQTYWDIAEVGAVKHLGMTLLDARIPSRNLSLRGPVAATADMDESVFTALKGLTPLSLARMVDWTNSSNGTWFLLEIENAAPPRTAMTGWLCVQAHLCVFASWACAVAVFCLFVGHGSSPMPAVSLDVRAGGQRHVAGIVERGAPQTGALDPEAGVENVQ